GKSKKCAFRILLIDTDTAFDGHGNAYSGFHCSYAISNQSGFGHQAGSEPAFLNAIGGTANVEVDFVVAELGADAGRLCARMRVATAKLKADGVFEWVEAKKARAVATQHRARGEHLGVDQCMSCEQTVEIPAVAIRPLHHRSDTKAPSAD